MTEEQKPKLKLIDILNGMKSDVPAFIGFSGLGPVGVPTEIKRWGQFIVKFGGYRKSGFLATSVNGFFISGGKRCYVLNLGERPEYPEEWNEKYEEGLKTLDGIEEISIIISPGDDRPEIHQTMLNYCEKRGIFALLDGPEEQVKTVNEVVEPKERDGALDAETEHASGAEESEGYRNMPIVNGNYGTIIYPWIQLKDRVLGNMYIPPTGHVAGILSKFSKEEDIPQYVKLEGTIWMKQKFSPEEIGMYKVRGINFLEFRDKRPAIIFEQV